jgi:hypothetical protein
VCHVLTLVNCSYKARCVMCWHWLTAVIRLGVAYVGTG